MADGMRRCDPHSRRAVATTGPGTARLPAATSDTVAVAKAMIALIYLVHPLLNSTFMTPVNAWNMVAARTAYLVLETTSQAEAVDVFFSVNLADSML